MMEKEPIDDFVKRKLEEADLSYEESYWLKAEALLEAEDKRRKRALFFWWFSALSFVLLIGIGGLIWHNQMNLNFKNDHTSLSEVGNPNAVNPASTLSQKSSQPDIAIHTKGQKLQDSLTELSSMQPMQNKIHSTSQVDFSKESQSTANSSKNKGLRSSISERSNHANHQSNRKGAFSSGMVLRSVEETPVDTTLANSRNYISAQELSILNRLPARLISEEAILGPEFKKEDSEQIVTSKEKSADKVQEKKSRTDLELFTHAPVSAAWGIGLRRTQYLRSRLSFTYGVGALSQHGLSQSFNWDSISYGFGFSQTQNTLRPIWMLEGLIHAGLLFKLHRSHALSIGFNWHLPIYSLEEVTSRQVSDFEQYLLSTTQQWGSPSGLIQSYSIQLGYEFACTSRFSLGAYWIGQRRNWQSSAKDPVQDISQFKLSGRWKIW